MPNDRAMTYPFPYKTEDGTANLVVDSIIVNDDGYFGGDVHVHGDLQVDGSFNPAEITTGHITLTDTNDQLRYTSTQLEIKCLDPTIANPNVRLENSTGTASGQLVCRTLALSGSSTTKLESTFTNTSATSNTTAENFITTKNTAGYSSSFGNKGSRGLVRTAGMAGLDFEQDENTDYSFKINSIEKVNINANGINGQIGETQAKSGKFTTLNSSSTTTLANTTATSLDSTPIGPTTPSTARFTTVDASGQITQFNGGRDASFVASSSSQAGIALVATAAPGRRYDLYSDSLSSSFKIYNVTDAKELLKISKDGELFQEIIEVGMVYTNTKTFQINADQIVFIQNQVAPLLPDIKEQFILNPQLGLIFSKNNLATASLTPTNLSVGIGTFTISMSSPTSNTGTTTCSSINCSGQVGAGSINAGDASFNGAFLQSGGSHRLAVLLQVNVIEPYSGVWVDIKGLRVPSGYKTQVEEFKAGDSTIYALTVSEGAKFQGTGRVYEFETGTVVKIKGQAEFTLGFTVPSLTVTGALTVQGATNLQLTTVAGGGLTVSTGGIRCVAGGITVTAGGVIVTAGGLSIQAGGLNVTGVTALQGDLSVTGACQLNGVNTIAGATTVSGSLTTTGSNIFNGTTTQNGALTVVGAATFAGVTNIGAAQGEFRVAYGTLAFNCGTVPVVLGNSRVNTNVPFVGYSSITASDPTAININAECVASNDSGGRATIKGLGKVQIQGGRLDIETTTYAQDIYMYYLQCDGLKTLLNPGYKFEVRLKSNNNPIFYVTENYEMILYNSASENVTVKVSPSTTSYTLMLPTTRGTAGQVLTASGSDSTSLTWATITPSLIGNTTISTTSGVTLTLNSNSAVTTDYALSATKSGGFGTALFTNASASATGGTIQLVNNSAGTPQYSIQATHPNVPSGGYAMWQLQKTSATGEGYQFAYLHNTTASLRCFQILQNNYNASISIFKDEVIGTSLTSGTLVVTGDISTNRNIRANGFRLHGSTSGIISILPQATAGTYNFNLPTTAGTAGQVLTSQGGGTNSMTWTTVTGGGTGGGTVTSIGIAVPSWMTVSNSPVTTSGVITLGAGSTGSGNVVLQNFANIASPSMTGTATGEGLVLSGTRNPLLQLQNLNTGTHYGIIALSPSLNAGSSIIYSFGRNQAIMNEFDMYFRYIGNNSSSNYFENTFFGQDFSTKIFKNGINGTSSGDGTFVVNGGISASNSHFTGIGSNVLNLKNSIYQTSIYSSAAYSYNFNLPSTPGTAGQILTSQGGGFDAMTWTDIQPFNGTFNTTSLEASDNIQAQTLTIRNPFFLNPRQVTLMVSSAQSANYTWIFPTTLGNDNDILTKVSGNQLGWTSTPIFTSLQISNLSSQRALYCSTQSSINAAVEINNISYTNNITTKIYAPFLNEGQYTETRYGKQEDSLNYIAARFNYGGYSSNSNSYEFIFGSQASSIKIFKDNVTATSSAGTLVVNGGLNAKNIVSTGEVSANSYSINGTPLFQEGSATPTLWWNNSPTTGYFTLSYNDQRFRYSKSGKSITFSLSFAVTINYLGLGAFILEDVFLDNMPNIPAYFGNTSIQCL